MTHILKRLAAAACMTLTLGIAFAGQPLKIESITYEPQANVNGEQLLLNGAGLRTKIFFKVYTAGLYLKAPARRNTEVMVLQTPKMERFFSQIGTGVTGSSLWLHSKEGSGLKTRGWLKSAEPVGRS